MDAYLERYLAFMGPVAAEKIAASVSTTTTAALRDLLRQVADLGADEILLTPTTTDPDELDRVADIIA
jgi:dihydrodipicolinate synthase/N-acetylneuraminate lyase